MKNNGRIWLLVSVILLSVTLLPACQFSSVEPELGSPTVQALPEEPASVEPDAGSPAVQAPPEEPAADLYYLVQMDPAEVDNSELPITPVEKLHRTGLALVDVDIEQYRLIIDGLVENPLTLTYQDILTYPTVTKVVLLICYNFFADNAEWTGVPVKTLLDEAEVKPEATEVIFYGMDGYQSSISLETAQESGVFLAHTVNGQILPLEHGYPLRLVVEYDFGSEWVKWVDHIEVR